MKNLKKTTIRHGFIAVLTALATVAYLFLVSPSHLGLILLAGLLISLTVNRAVAMFAVRKYQIISFAATLTFLIMNYLVGFELVNTFLYVSFIIGLIFLLR